MAHLLNDLFVPQYLVGDCTEYYNVCLAHGIKRITVWSGVTLVVAVVVTYGRQRRQRCLASWVDHQRLNVRCPTASVHPSSAHDIRTCKQRAGNRQCRPEQLNSQHSVRSAMWWSYIHTCAVIAAMARLSLAEGEFYVVERKKKTFILQYNNIDKTQWHFGFRRFTDARRFSCGPLCFLIVFVHAHCWVSLWKTCHDLAEAYQLVIWFYSVLLLWV